MISSTRVWRSAALVALVGMALAACGGSSGGDTGTGDGGAKTLTISSDLPLQGSSKDAAAAMNNASKVAVMGTYNSGCAKIIVPVLNQDPDGPMLMVSHANTNPGLTKTWDPGEPDKYYPSGTRNYARIIATDDF